MVERTPELDLRIARHEASHVVVGLLRGAEFGGATITAGPDYAGRVWGPQSGPSHLGAPTVDEICGTVSRQWPQIGESRTDAAPFYVHVIDRVTELLAGSVGEQIYYPDDQPLRAIDDDRQALLFASLVCSTTTSVQAFLDFARAEAWGLIQQHRHVVDALAVSLLEQRTLDAKAIHATVATALAAEDAKTERQRRADWAAAIENAKSFQKEKAENGP
jgi:hypothetical protein